MGCFSFICKECDRPVLSTSFTGQEVELFLLENGKVLQHMSGQYNSYGCVFIEGTQRSDVEHELKDSVKWNLDWSGCCELMFDNDKSNGIAAIHTKCWQGDTPTTRSEDDPNQGWGDDYEYIDNCDDEVDFSDEEIE